MAELITLANIVTLVRMILIPVFVTFIFYHQLEMALVIWLVAGFSDLLDGLLARKLNQTTSLGVILDPIADKLLLVTAFVVLSLHSFVTQPIPFWLTAAVISRDVFIVVGALMIFITTGFRRFRPSFLGKASTLFQLTLITAFLAANIWSHLGEYLLGLYYSTFAMAIISGLHYIFHANQLLNEQGSRNG